MLFRQAIAVLYDSQNAVTWWNSFLFRENSVPVTQSYILEKLGSCYDFNKITQSTFSFASISVEKMKESKKPCCVWEIDVMYLMCFAILTNNITRNV